MGAKEKIMILGTVCMSHSPLQERNRPAPETDAKFDAALREVATFVADLKPDLIIILYPDHVNGFHYNLLPCFCVGVEGTSIGDYSTVAGTLDIPCDQSLDMSRAILDSGVDVALSYNMQVDHGAMQPLEWLSQDRSLSRFIPIFMNCAAPPLPTFERARALGKAVGDWARSRPERVLIIGSGGLSHDPPVPALATATDDVRNRLIQGGSLNYEQRAIREHRAHQEGLAMAEGKSTLLPANPQWDRMILDALIAGDLTVLDDASDESISATGGRGGHEVRTWIAALAALGPNYSATEIFYAAIDEWITGMGILRATPT
jgi:2,3-dihydroxyphenylpropionate 1,2-dioxygenase